MFKYYVVIRNDLSVREQVCQVSHASAEAAEAFGSLKHCNVGIMQVRCREDLLKLHEKLEKAGIDHVLIDEPDPKQNPVGVTCICTGPLEADKWKAFAQCKLYQGVPIPLEESLAS